MRQIHYNLFSFANAETFLTQRFRLERKFSSYAEAEKNANFCTCLMSLVNLWSQTFVVYFHQNRQCLLQYLLFKGITFWIMILVFPDDSWWWYPYLMDYEEKFLMLLLSCDPCDVTDGSELELAAGDNIILPIAYSGCCTIITTRIRITGLMWLWISRSKSEPSTCGCQEAVEKISNSRRCSRWNYSCLQQNAELQHE